MIASPFPPGVHSILLALAMVVAPAAMAATPVVNLPPSYFGHLARGTNESHGNGMVGWTFHVTSTITITQVGWYDEGSNGLSRDFQVGLWRSVTGSFAAGQETVSLLGENGVVIPAGTGTSFNGLYRYINLPSALTLQPGYYQIGGMDTATTTDPIKYFWYNNIALAPGTGPQSFSFQGLSYAYFFHTAQAGGDSSFRPATSDEFHLTSGVELGPMLFAIPEPSALMLAGAGGLILLRRRRARA